VVDPDGPLPERLRAAGGVFAGTLANRQAQRVPARSRMAGGERPAGKSPDGSGRAVFAVALADGPRPGTR
jgi:hypothetical protein